MNRNEDILQGQIVAWYSLEYGKKQQEVLQQPAELGVEVPHGMTFEGTPKRIMLHSDHFRIYF